jgi:hypothetical protein
MGDIRITPNRDDSNDPNIEFIGISGVSGSGIYLNVLEDGSLSFEGTAGQLFSITDSLTGTIFSVNDIAGIPSVEVDDDGTIRLAEFAGNVLIGTNTDDGSSRLQVDGNIAVKNSVMQFKKSGTQTDSALEFYVGSNIRGSISYSDTGTSYNVTSDYRLKENVVEITDGIERLKQLKPSRFNFISNTEKVVDGFIAHEVESVIPEAVIGEKDATEEYEVTPAEYDDYGNLVSEAVMGTRDAYQQIDQAKIVPLLTAALQEAIAKIESLEARIQSLENN